MKRIWMAALLLAAPAHADDLSARVDMIVTGAIGPQTDAERYCRNIADAAREAKFEWQVKTIAELEDALAERTRALEAKRAEVEAWIGQRRAFMDMAQDRLVAIYAKMKPDAASAQMQALDPLSAAALLLKLQPRTASAILNEMPADKAGALAALMVSAADDGRAQDGPAQDGPAQVGPAQAEAARAEP